MLDKETVLIFPSQSVTQVDGLPNFGILFTDLKDAMNPKTVSLAKKAKKSLKPKTDTGLKHNEDSDEDDDGVGGGGGGQTFDPKHFRGARELYNHLTNFQFNMMTEYQP